MFDYTKLILFVALTLSILPAILSAPLSLTANLSAHRHSEAQQGTMYKRDPAKGAAKMVRNGESSTQIRTLTSVLKDDIFFLEQSQRPASWWTVL